jgi:hypothetical protein
MQSCKDTESVKSAVFWGLLCAFALGSFQFSRICFAIASDGLSHRRCIDTGLTLPQVLSATLPDYLPLPWYPIDPYINEEFLDRHFTFPAALIPLLVLRIRPKSGLCQRGLQPVLSRSIRTSRLPPPLPFILDVPMVCPMVDC